MLFKSFFERARKGKKGNRDSSDAEVLVLQVKRAVEFERLLYAAVKTERRVTLRIEAEGHPFTCGVILWPGDPMIENLLNFASGTRLAYQGRLEAEQKRPVANELDDHLGGYSEDYDWEG